MHIQPANTQKPKHFFMFESKQYYVQFDAPNYPGKMIFTGSGIACEKVYHPELWYYQEQQQNFDQLKKSETF